MTLVVHEIKAEGVEQSLTPNKNLILRAVRPHIYRHNFADGSLKVQIYDADDNLLTESNEVAIEDIFQTNPTAEYFHGYVTFEVSIGLKKDVLYKFKIVGVDDYSFNESAWCGVCNDFDLRKYPAVPTPESLVESPLDIELWSLSTR